MDSNILNLLNQGFARQRGYEEGLKAPSNQSLDGEKWYEKGLGDSKKHFTKVFAVQKELMTLAAKTEANINAYTNASIMQGGSPSYGIYDLKTDLISFYSWGELIRRLKAGYEYEGDAVKRYFLYTCTRSF